MTLLIALPTTVMAAPIIVEPDPIEEGALHVTPGRVETDEPSLRLEDGRLGVAVGPTKASTPRVYVENSNGNGYLFATTGRDARVREISASPQVSRATGGLMNALPDLDVRVPPGLLP